MRFLQGLSSLGGLSSQELSSQGLSSQENFSLIWQVVFKLGYILCQER